MPKITVLVATKNSERFIRGCLDSLLHQTVIRDTEILVIDGDSRESEKEIVSGYQKGHPQVKYIYTGTPGLYHAWNLGVRASRGEYITNLNTDDRLKNNALEIMAKALDDNPDVGLVYGDSYVTAVPNETFERNSSAGRRLNRPAYSHKLLIFDCLPGSHPMWRRKIHDEIGYFDESFVAAGDYEFWMRMAENYKMLRIPAVIGLYYENKEGISLKDHELTHRETRKVHLKYLNQGRTQGFIVPF